MTKKRSGFIVETQSGKVGKIFSDKKLINGKIPVYVDELEKPLLSTPETLKIIGRFD